MVIILRSVRTQVRPQLSPDGKIDVEVTITVEQPGPIGQPVEVK